MTKGGGWWIILLDIPICYNVTLLHTSMQGTSGRYIKECTLFHHPLSLMLLCLPRNPLNLTWISFLSTYPHRFLSFDCYKVAKCCQIFFYKIQERTHLFALMLKSNVIILAVSTCSQIRSFPEKLFVSTCPQIGCMSDRAYYISKMNKYITVRNFYLLANKV